MVTRAEGSTGRDDYVGEGSRDGASATTGGPGRPGGDTSAAEAHGTGGHGADGHGGGEAHASNRTYVGVAVVLAVLTALEVMVFYIPALEGVLVPILMALMVVKFALVVMFFMHLKYDSQLLTGLFAGPLLIASAIVLAMIALYGWFGTGGLGYG